MIGALLCVFVVTRWLRLKIEEGVAEQPKRSEDSLYSATTRRKSVKFAGDSDYIQNALEAG
jgi:hypothetical protein